MFKWFPEVSDGITGNLGLTTVIQEPFANGNASDATYSPTNNAVVEERRRGKRQSSNVNLPPTGKLQIKV